ncbi:MAG: hypothetical protein M1832_001925 [Thelocarpon impressellum]|nr:MAG: hypothetical protein M1832_001925 [Thelocarpon impressellum]
MTGNVKSDTNLSFSFGGLVHGAARPPSPPAAASSTSPATSPSVQELTVRPSFTAVNEHSKGSAMSVTTPTVVRRKPSADEILESDDEDAPSPTPSTLPLVKRSRRSAMAVSPQATSTPHTVSTASLLKRSYAHAFPPSSASTPASPNTQGSPDAVGGRPPKPTAEHDPENHQIRRLREAERLNWGEIAKVLNEERIAAGKIPGLTDNAVYSRYTRNASKIAAVLGEDSRTADCRRSNVGADGKAGGPRRKKVRWTDELDEMLVRAYKDVMASVWEQVAEKMRGEHEAETVEAAECAKRYQML